ncbi:MAG: hypothetical protein MJ110_01485 [Lachnospiraceae bacterium]|nr:hypothetical protein [Lachnospiraceae bacterium]
MDIIMRIKNFIIIHGMNFLSHLPRLKREMVDFHLAENRRAWGNYAPGLKYIEIQNKLTDISYGKYKADYNACEVIAVQNALIALGLEHDTEGFPYLLAEFERKGSILKGFFGTAPKAIVKYLKNKGVAIEKLTPVTSNLGKTSVQILIYQNGSKITSGIHTICILGSNTPIFLNGRPGDDSVLLRLYSLYLPPLS